MKHFSINPLITLLAVLASFSLVAGLRLHDQQRKKKCEVTKDSPLPCKEGLLCIEGFCECPFHKLQFYDNVTKECISYVQGPCNEIIDGKEQTFSCVKNAECRSNSFGFHACACIEGFTAVGHLPTCLAGNGGPCSGPKECDPFAIFDYTNNGKGLECINGKCQCRSEYFYDEDKGKCRGLVGAYCSDTSAFSGFCTTGAKCARSRGSRMTYDGYCECTGGYEPTANRTCIYEDY